MNDTENNNGVYRGMPWWVKAIGVVGAPYALVLILLYLMNGILADTKTAAGAALVEARGTLTAVRAVHEQHTQELIALWKICRRVSKSDAERDACD